MQHRIFHLLAVSFLLVAPLRSKAASYLFAFDGASPAATVYDAQTLERLASPAVGRHAGYAFGVADPADARRIAKFYVVGEGAVAILNADFSVHGNVFLPEPLARGSHAAALSPDGRRLLVAAGNNVYVIDTATDQIAATLDPGFAPALVVALPGSERAYVASTESTFLRVIDLTANELLDTIAELPTVPTAMAASPNGSKLYAASPGALYDLTQLTSDFFQPLAALQQDRRADPRFTLANASGRLPSLKNDAPDSIRNQRLAIDRLLLTNNDQFLMRLGDGFRRGRLDATSPFLDFRNPASGEPFAPSEIAAVAVSPDGAALYIATRGQPRLVKSDSSCTVEQRAVDLAEAPVAMALVAGPVEQQNCTMAKGGDGQVVVENTAFFLTVGDSTTATGGVQGNVTTSAPSIVSCDRFLISGPTTFVCRASEVDGLTDVQITVDSFLGCAIYNIKVAPQGSTVDGLTKLFGDGISILRGSTFQLLAEARTGGTPQGNLLLNVVATPSSAVACPATVPTALNGVATLNCTAGNVTANTNAQIQVTDSTTPSRTVTFAVTVLASGNPSTGLNKVSADPRLVASTNTFDLIVQAFSGTTPQNGLVLTVSPDSTFLNCAAQATTNAEGLASISCTAATVITETQVRVTVGDGTRSVVFFVNIVPSGSLINGLSIVSGNNQFVPRGSNFLQPLTVRAVNQNGPQPRIVINVARNPATALFCPTSLLTDDNGIAEIHCSAAIVAAPTFVTINASDTSTPPRSLPEPFQATILPGAPGLASDVVILSALTVEGKVGETLPEGVRVRAVTPVGAAVPNAIVYFSTTEDLSFNPPVGITNQNGELATAVTFGCPTRNTGVIEIKLQPDTPTRTVDFRAVRGDLAAVTKQRGDNQGGGAGLILGQALLVLAGDACSNGIPGLPVTWTVSPPEAAELVAPVSQLTDNAGHASTRVRLANRSGPFTISAAIEGFTTVFNLATTVVANRIEISSGNNQSVPLLQPSSQPLVVKVASDNGVGVNGINVTFNVISGSGTVSPSATTDGQGLAAATVTAGNVFGPIVVEAAAVIQNQTRTVRFTINTVGRSPMVTLLGFVNGASFLQGWVPGSTGTIFGVGLMEGVDGVALPTPNIAALSLPGPAQAAGIWPTEFRGVSVTVNGVRAPILGLANVNGQEQVNIQVPFGIPSPGVVPVVVTNNGSSTTISGAQVATVQPGIFGVSVEGGRFAAALHADYTLVTPSNPARPGEVIQLFLTGLGATNPAVGTNVVGPVPLARTVLEPSVSIDNAPQAVAENSAFYAPGLVTVYQINFVVGANVQAGNRSLTVSIGGASSPAVSLPVQR
jgi:uncharacterized protein (TIGR03437 family)